MYKYILSIIAGIFLCSSSFLFAKTPSNSIHLSLDNLAYSSGKDMLVGDNDDDDDDGMNTPSYCDELVFSSNKLNKICRKYCDKLDCETIMNQEDPLCTVDYANDLKKCTKESVKYSKEMLEYDPDLACSAPVTCPCFTSESLKQGLNSLEAGCGLNESESFTLVNNVTNIRGVNVSLGINWSFIGFGVNDPVGLDDSDLPQCVENVQNCALGTGVVIIDQITTPAEAEACKDVINSLSAAQ